MLVATLEIDIGLPVLHAFLFGMMQLRSLHDYRARAGTGIDPYIERVHRFTVGLGAFPVSGLYVGPEGSCVAFEPDVGPVFFNERGGVTHDAGIEDRFGAGIKRRDRHAPGALAADAPIGPAFHRAFDSVLAPAGHPVHFVDGGERLLTEILVIDLDEPLIHRPENHRRLTAPTVWVAVRILLVMHESIESAEERKHGFVGFASTVLFENGLADQLRGHLCLGRQIIGVGEFAGVIDRRINGQAVLAAEPVILQSVPGRDVHKPRAGAILYKRIAGQHWAGLVDERMHVTQLAQFRAGNFLERLDILPAARLGHLGQQRSLEQIRFCAHFCTHVGELRIICHGEVGWKCPGRGGPDDQERVFLAFYRALHKNRLADVIRVLHFGLGQRRTAGDAPVHGLFATIDKTLFNDIRK